MSRTQPQEYVDDPESAVDMAIEACDGDLHDTIRSLVIANSFLLEEVARYKSLISHGFMRGRLSLYDLL